MTSWRCGRERDIVWVFATEQRMRVMVLGVVPAAEGSMRWWIHLGLADGTLLPLMGS
ncbi:MAG: hypothetical protein AB2A00_40020 [Myxococcota bacterium]